MKKELEIFEIQPKHFDFISNTIKLRWNVIEKESKNFTDSYLNKRNNNNCFVAEWNGDCVGMGTFHTNNDIGVDLHPWCIGLWVHPDYRGHGIGYKLTLRRFSWARQLGYKKIYLDTVNAMKYHSRFGWKKIDQIVSTNYGKTTIMEYNL